MHGDARCYAATILENLQHRQLKSSFCCYGTENNVLIGIGRASSLQLAETGTLDAVWTAINEYIEANSTTYIFGFIGFDPANQLNKKIDDYRQKIDLFAPDTVIQCTPSGCTVIKGNLDIATLDTPPEPRRTNPVDINIIDLSELRKQYAESVSDFIDAIKAGSLERATLARKINTDCEFELSGTFITDHSQHELARSFYFSNEYVAFAGQSPELLAEGNTRSFATHKLSGTHAKDSNFSITELSHRFQTDPRIISEHESAITAIEHSLTRIGRVQSKKFEVMELPTLLHGWSKFTTQPKENVSIAMCLRSVFPFGVNPMAQGFKLLALHEDFCRGPYYGLIGCIRPDGEFSFTQVLRSAFIDNESSYLMVGAAITSKSTPELEMTETCCKLSSIKAFESIKSQDVKPG